MAVLLMCTKILRGPFWCGRQAHDQQDMFLLRCDGVAVGTGRADVLRKRAALKTVHLPNCEEYQNRYVQKITPNLNGTPDTLQKCFM
jgi:hypothetical protein